MTRKNPFEDLQTAFSPEMADRVKDQAQQIWLAGLGAFAKAQEEGAKAFEKLVKDGVDMQRKTQSVAEEKLAEMTHRMSAMADDVTERAGSQFGRLEGIFEERVAKALHRLNVPTSTEIAALRADIEALQASLSQMGVKPKPSARAAAKAPAAKSPVAKKAAARKKA